MRSNNCLSIGRLPLEGGSVHPCGKFDWREFVDFMIKQDVIKFDSYTISSTGEESPIYFDFRDLSDNFWLDEISKYVHSFVAGTFGDVNSYVGVPYSAVALGVRLSGEYGDKVIIAREEDRVSADSKAKKHFVGLKNGDKVIVVEDVVTTGANIDLLIANLKLAGADVRGALALVDRQERSFASRDDGSKYGVSDYIRREYNTNFNALVDINRVLFRYMEMGGLDDKIKADLISYYEKNGCGVISGKKYATHKEDDKLVVREVLEGRLKF